tara:strand:+ start:256 stop:603 length:348 start_codon:yes stop_codon:yes gene_type:complete
MIHILIIVTLAIILLLLVRRGLIQVDMSFPWLASIIVLGFLSTSSEFVEWAALQLGIIYPPIAIVFISMFVVFGLVTVLLVGFTRLRRRQIRIVRYLALVELMQQRNNNQTTTNS